jgi:hypothetical protein
MEAVVSDTWILGGVQNNGLYVWSVAQWQHFLQLLVSCQCFGCCLCRVDAKVNAGLPLYPADASGTLQPGADPW